jgi:GAF domain-containing protein
VTLKVSGDAIKSVLCVPVVTPDGECLAVIELYRQVNQGSFSKDDLKITIVVTGWMGAAIHQNQQRVALKKQQELNEYLLDLTKNYFSDTVMMEKMISDVVVSAAIEICMYVDSFDFVEVRQANSWCRTRFVFHHRQRKRRVGGRLVRRRDRRAGHRFAQEKHENSIRQRTWDRGTGGENRSRRQHQRRLQRPPIQQGDRSENWVHHKIDTVHAHNGRGGNSGSGASCQ